jgi:hypothetical protein
LEHYQKYVEHEDKQKIKTLHEQNFHFQSIVSDFVTFYYKQDDLSRVQTLLSAARATNFCTAIERILIQLHVEIFRSQQTQTFEAFRLFNEVKHYMTLNAREFDPKVNTSLEQLKAKAPSCLRLLLWPEKNENQLRLVNKFFDSPLCIQHEKVLCCSADDEELLCSATVDTVKVLTSFSFNSDDSSLNLGASDGTTKISLVGTQWRLKAVDEHHVKICTDDGKIILKKIEIGATFEAVLFQASS